MELTERILAYIENHHPISYTKLLNVAQGKGFNELEVLQALDKVGRDKSIVTKTRRNEVWYDFVTAPAPVKTPTHITWWRENYPIMTPETDGSGIDIDLGHLFLRTLEERQAYQAEAKGMPQYMLKKNYAR